MFKHYLVSTVGLLLGVALLVLSDQQFRLQSNLTATALAGAGAVVIFWAGRRLSRRLKHRARPRPLD